MEKDKFFQTYNNVLESLDVLCNESKEVIKDALSKHGNTIVLDENDDYLSITYFDGYCVVSSVISVNLKPDGAIVVETEDCKEIYSEKISELDLANIAYYILNKYEDWLW